jgi:site-specific DNA-methyltransferase (adenine-specific)
MREVIQGDCLEVMKSMSNNSVDIIYTDPPYALGSEITVRPDGKVDYDKAIDFMDKWDMPTAGFWEEWYKEANRVLKYGGHCIMFGMDRQLLLFKYYAHLAGFTEKQSMYWYFISNFPKATDLSKMIDKNAGAEREITGYKSTHINRQNTENWKKSAQEMKHSKFKTETSDTTGGGLTPIAEPSTPLAKKYSGYKYSIAPLKQTNETIMIFQRPYKTGSCLHDTLAVENGLDFITCGALDIDGNRVGTESYHLLEETPKEFLEEIKKYIW